jgi:hypothetical protein
MADSTSVILCYELMSDVKSVKSKTVLVFWTFSELQTNIRENWNAGILGSIVTFLPVESNVKQKYNNL